jgi:hypothetical protein
MSRINPSRRESFYEIRTIALVSQVVDAVSVSVITRLADMQVGGLKSDRILEITSPGGIRTGRSIEFCSLPSIETIFDPS